jgi:hypothetical protein
MARRKRDNTRRTRTLRSQRLYGNWYGGDSYTRDPNAIEVFSSIGEALTMFDDRWLNLDGATPGVNESATMFLYRVDPRGSVGAHPYAEIVMNSSNDSVVRSL